MQGRRSGLLTALRRASGALDDPNGLCMDAALTAPTCAQVKELQRRHPGVLLIIEARQR